MEDIESSTMTVGTQRRLVRAESAERDLLEDNESTENLDSEKEEKMAFSRTLNAAHRRRWNTLVCVLMITVTLPLFAFGGYALSLQHQAFNPDNDSVKWASFESVGQKLATIFPILFATVVGWCLKKLAQWKLEQGSTLEPLERLMGSQTFVGVGRYMPFAFLTVLCYFHKGSTIITQSKLGMFHAIAVCLVLIWMLSPFGSQASLHLVRIEPRVFNTLNVTTYFDTLAKPGFATPDFKADVALNALFTSVLIGVRPPNPGTLGFLGTVDPLDNLIIPDLGHFMQFIAEYPNETDAVTFVANSTGWYNISVAYSLFGQYYSSSALGLPISLGLDGYDGYNNATFAIETSFISVNCSNNTLHHDGALPTTPLDSSLFTSATNGSLINGTYYGIKSNATFSLAINGFYQQDPYGSVSDLLHDESIQEPLTLLFQSQVNATGGSDVTSAFCQLTTSYYECDVSCQLSTWRSESNYNICQVNAVRPSQLPHPNSNLTDLGFIGTFTSFLESLAAASVVPPGTSSAFELYMSQPSNPASAGIAAADLSQIDPLTLADNFQQLLNAYFYGSYDPLIFMSGGAFCNEFCVAPYMPQNRTAPALYSMWTLEYQCAPAWLFVYFLASFVMLAAAIYGAILNHYSNAPETLGFCSTVVKDNPHVQGSDVGSAMSGFSRTKEFRNLRLKLVDIERENEHGYLAIVQDDGRYANLPRKSARLYR